jgi:hypothetical protein
MHLKMTPRQALNAATPPKPWTGQSSRGWAAKVAGPRFHALALLPRDPMDRAAVQKYCANKAHSDELCFLAVMAWGGMRRDHGRSAWRNRDQGLLRAIAQLRKSTTTRREAYALFEQLRTVKKLPGVGPAYFTKLIFFLNPKLNGYILDQWTAKSVNLLFPPFVHLTVGATRGTDTVSNKNSADVYEKFCARLDQLGGTRGGAEAERLLFSQARPTNSHWRYYVRRKWHPKKHNFTR